MDDPTAKSRDETSDDRRLADLQRRISAARQQSAGAARGGSSPGPGGEGGSGQGMSLGLKLAGEFTSAILVGAVFGYGIDHFAGSSPWGLVIGLGFGFAAGVTGLVRAARAYSARHTPGADVPQDPVERE